MLGGFTKSENTKSENTKSENTKSENIKACIKQCDSIFGIYPAYPHYPSDKYMCFAQCGAYDIDNKKLEPEKIRHFSGNWF
jgi:hypothetical protein